MVSAILLTEIGVNNVIAVAVASNTNVSLRRSKTGCGGNQTSCARPVSIYGLCQLYRCADVLPVANIGIANMSIPLSNRQCGSCSATRSSTARYIVPLKTLEWCHCNGLLGVLTWHLGDVRAIGPDGVGGYGPQVTLAAFLTSCRTGWEYFFQDLLEFNAHVWTKHRIR